MEWLPIEKYDELKKKPENCIFFVKEKKREYSSGIDLSATISTARFYGFREVTHYLVLPKFPIKD